jgi:hypothetical protein
VDNALLLFCLSFRGGMLTKIASLTAATGSSTQKTQAAQPLHSDALHSTQPLLPAQRTLVDAGDEVQGGVPLVHNLLVLHKSSGTAHGQMNIVEQQGTSPSDLGWQCTWW